MQGQKNLKITNKVKTRYLRGYYWCNFRREQFGATVGWFVTSTCRSEGSRRPELEEKELQSRTSFTQKPKQSALKCKHGSNINNSVL